MLFTQISVAVGVAYAGARTFTQYPWNAFRQPFWRRQRAVMVTVEPATAPGQTPEIVEGELESPADDDVTVREAKRYQLVAASAVVLAIGGLAFPALTVASVPFTLYSSAPMFETASRKLVHHGRLHSSLFTSSLIVVWLLTDRYIPAATLAWLHHSLWLWNRDIKTVAKQRKNDLLARVQGVLRQATGAPPQTVWMVDGDVEVETFFDAVKDGDVLVVSAGEFVPVGGEIITGDAKLYRLLSNVVGAPTTVRVGDRLEPGALVIEGKMRIRVTGPPSANST